MKKHILSLFTILALLLSGCGSKKNLTQKFFDQQSDSFKLSMERTACFGKCPIYTIKITDNGTLEFDGQKFVEPQGKHTVQVSPEDMATLKKMMVEINFLGLEDKYDTEYISDIPSTITILYRGLVEEKKVLNRHNGPAKLKEFETFVDSLWKKQLLAR